MLFPHLPPDGHGHRCGTVIGSTAGTIQVTCNGETTPTRDGAQSTRPLRLGQETLRATARTGVARLVGFDLHTPPAVVPRRHHGCRRCSSETLPLLVTTLGSSTMPDLPAQCQQFQSSSFGPTRQRVGALLSRSARVTGHPWATSGRLSPAHRQPDQGLASYTAISHPRGMPSRTSCTLVKLNRNYITRTHSFQYASPCICTYIRHFCRHSSCLPTARAPCRSVTNVSQRRRHIHHSSPRHRRNTFTLVTGHNDRPQSPDHSWREFGLVPALVGPRRGRSDV